MDKNGNLHATVAYAARVRGWVGTRDEHRIACMWTWGVSVCSHECQDIAFSSPKRCPQEPSFYHVLTTHGHHVTSAAEKHHQTRYSRSLRHWTADRPRRFLARLLAVKASSLMIFSNYAIKVAKKLFKILRDGKVLRNLRTKAERKVKWLSFVFSFARGPFGNAAEFRYLWTAVTY
jgi:hypothetical protein